jgi:hypothetical protein
LRAQERHRSFRAPHRSDHAPATVSFGASRVPDR